MSLEPPPKTGRKNLTLLVGVVMVVLIAIWLGRQPPDRRDTDKDGLPTLPTERDSGSATTPSPGLPHPTSLLRQLGTASDHASRRGLLESLRESLATLPADEAARLIENYLQTGEDAPTGQAFAIGQDGYLSGAPTVRVWLLDQLGRISPKDALRQAQLILAEPTHPDEWALAMKYQAQAGDTAESHAFLKGKLREMWANASWASQPSVGYLEAFDVVVHLGDTDLVPDLTAMVRDKEKRATGHAAYLALDRMVIRNPTATLAMLAQSPELMEGREQTRANYFARADMRHPDQRQILEHYLLDPHRTPEELQAFAGIFPNANYMVSHNLLTPVVTPDGRELMARDRAALEVIMAWREDDRFARLGPHLDMMQRRLETFAGEAATD